MEAWDILFDNSILGPGHDAWEHLNAQEGGSGGGTTIIVGEVELDVSQENVDVNILDAITVNAQNNETVHIKVNNAVSVDVVSDEITVETCK